MDNTKETGVVTSQHAVDNEADRVWGQDVAPEKRGTNEDARDMYRLGKLQEMRRNFRFVTIFGFSMILMATWETALGTAIIALVNGGTAGLIWIYLVGWIGFLAVNTSMAEMASMAPTSGGQYHWVSEFAPRKHQKLMSYIIGWLCVLGWQTGAASTAFLAGTQIQGVLVLNYPNYDFQRYQGTLLTIAVGLFSGFFNTFLAKRLPLIEGVVLIVHIFGFFAVIVTLWVMGPKGDAYEVFTTFNNFGGWSSNGASALVGIVAVIVPLLGADGAVHMSEELRDASKSLPRSMVWTTIVNGGMGWIMVITFCMTLGNLDAIIGSPTGQPFVASFYQATQSHVGASILSALVIFQAMFCNLSIVATSSRQLFAFARDHGTPFGNWLAYVPPGWDVPINSIVVSIIVTALLSIINIGSTIALNNITSLGTAAILSSYIVSIGCMIVKRIRNEPLLPSKFNLGKTGGLALNIFAEIFLLFAFVLTFFPGDVNPTPAEMNWAILVYGATIIGALVYYFFKGRHVYDGPVEYVRKLQD